MHYKEVKAILSPQNGLNIYRGCSYSCVFCDARSTCHRMDHEFEDIEVKAHAVDMLEYALKKKRTRSMIQIGSSSEPYIPLEEELQLVRRCLNQIERFDFGLVLHTHSMLALRDIDILDKINRKTKCIVIVRLSTYDDSLAKKLEPGTSLPSERFSLMQQLTERGITVIVNLAPILPFINDTEENISGILDMCAEAKVYGVICFGMGLTLREGNREYFYEQLDRLFPGLKEQYIRTYGDQYMIESGNSQKLMRLFHRKCEKYGFVHDNDQIFRYLSAFEEKDDGGQLSIWD